jgi:hypothetical protein
MMTKKLLKHVGGGGRGRHADEALSARPGLPYAMGG